MRFFRTHISCNYSPLIFDLTYYCLYLIAKRIVKLVQLLGLLLLLLLLMWFIKFIIYICFVIFRCGAISCTRWWVAEDSRGDLMRWITEKLSTETQASWANMISFQCCPTNLRGFYMSFMISGTLASICRPYQLIEATLMYMVQSITIRYESTVSVCL